MKKLFIILACLGAVFMVSNNLLATGGGGGGGDGTLDKQPQKPFYPDRESQDGTPPPKDEDFSIVKFFTGGHCFIDSTMDDSWLEEIFDFIWNPKTKQ